MAYQKGVVNTAVANAVAKALITESNYASLKAIAIDSSFWAKTLFKRIGFVKQASNTGRVEILDDARKETTLPFHYEIMN